VSTPQYGGSTMADQRPDRPLKQEPPNDVADRISRAMLRMRELAPLRNECWQFFRGNTYVYRTAEGQLAQLNTQPSSSGRGKPNHRVRTRRPIHMPFFRQEISYATQRVPGYEVNPTNSDPQTQNAARISEKVARYGYDKWRVKRATEKVVTSALVADEGYAWPMWDPAVGPRLGFDEKTESDLHEGEVCIRTLSSNQVGWEPGQDFDDSRWYMVVQAVPLDQVQGMAGFVGGKITADASDRSIIGQGRPASAKMVLVTEYLERPSRQHQDGRWLTLANGRVITPEKQYPLTDTKGKTVDEPCLHRLTWIVDPESDQDLGAMRFILDIVRSYQDAVNKQLEWKNLAANAQIITQPGALLSPLTDEPGAQIQVANPDRIKWRETPPVPPVLSEIQDRCKADLAFMLSQNDIPSQVEAARGIQALLERDQNARASFLANLAEFHGRVMRHCLALCARHYSEKRLIQINGWKSPEIIPDFKGADLLDQVNVIVSPNSLMPINRDVLEQRVMNWGQLGWIPPHIAMSAVNSGSVDGLMESYKLDVARANRIIQQIFLDPESVMDPDTILTFVPVPNPLTGQVTNELHPIPWYMPRMFDNLDIYMGEFEDAMKTERFDTAPEHVKTMLQIAYNGLIELKNQKAAQEQMQQAAQAEQMGMDNAAQPGTKPMPNIPAVSGPGAQVNPAAGAQ
jgi:hypothetical protein